MAPPCPSPTPRSSRAGPRRPGGWLARGQSPGRVAGWRPAQVRQDPGNVQQRRRLDHPGDHQVTEHGVSEHVEPRTGIHLGQRVEQQPAVRAHDLARASPATRSHGRRVEWGGVRRGGDDRGDRNRPFHRQVQRPLGGILKHLTRTGQQHPSSASVRTDPTLLDDPLTPTGVLRDLHRHDPRAGPHRLMNAHTRTLNQHLSA